MNKDIYRTSETLLHSVGINPTANRILVLGILLESSQPLSISDLNAILETVDLSTIFRTVSLFEEKNIVMCIDDGTKSPKYELLLKDDGSNIPEFHAHFYCVKCKTTECLTSVEIRDIKLPPNYQTDSVNFVVKGICAKCKRKKVPIQE